ncbi:MAG: energy-coupling factor transporter transmembrane component T family protein [Acidimicrobiales bacterium]
MKEINLLRYLPVRSPVHRLWAGTKAVGVLGVGIGAAVNPSWAALAVLAGFLGLVLALARVPWGARPRLPKWFWLWLAVGGAIALISGGRPDVHLGGLAIGLGSLGLWVRFTVLAGLVLLGAAILAWTTPMSELAPALSRLVTPLARGPFGWLRGPLEELAVVLALSVRCLSLLVSETRLLVAARQVRRPQKIRDWRQLFDEGVDLLVAVLVVSTRRAAEMGEAMEARGGFPARLPLGAAPGRADAAGFVLVVGTVLAMALV